MDRNDVRIAPIDGVIESLSARRAWIEILLALLTLKSTTGRSPQGERG